MKLFGLALAVLSIRSASSRTHNMNTAGAEKLGTVNFETSCKPATRADFNRAHGAAAFVRVPSGD